MLKRNLKCNLKRNLKCNLKHNLKRNLILPQTAVPDYEIISRLEKLVEAHQSHLQASQALEAGLRHMATGFR